MVGKVLEGLRLASYFPEASVDEKLLKGNLL